MKILTCIVGLLMLSAAGCSTTQTQLVSAGQWTEFEGCLVYVGELQGRSAKDIIIRETEHGQTVRTIRAVSGEFKDSADGKDLEIELSEAQIELEADADSEATGFSAETFTLVLPKTGIKD